MRKLLRNLVLVGTLCLASTAAFGADDITLVVNGKKIESSVKPIIKNNSTLVPVRTVGEAFGLEVEYDKKRDEVIVLNKTGNTAIALVEHVSKYIINGSTYIPLRDMGEQLLCETIDWNGKTRTVTLNRNETFRYKVGYKSMFDIEINKNYDGYAPMYVYRKADGTYDTDKFNEANRKSINFAAHGYYIIDDTDGQQLKGKNTIIAHISIGDPTKRKEMTDRYVRLLTDTNSNIVFDKELALRAINIAYDFKTSTDAFVNQDRDIWDSWALVDAGKIVSKCGKYSLVPTGSADDYQGRILLVKLD